MIGTNQLIAHKQNKYFFDDIEGEPWMAFIDSIKTSGIVEPIIATQDLIIVSGHQRVRAAIELGIKKVAVEIRHFDSEDEILKQLIETNIRQRGIGNTNAVKLGRCLKELDRIYGFQKGNNQHTDSLVQNAPSSQKELADGMGISIDAYKRYESLTNLIPEIADMVDNGITMTSAVAIARKLSPEQQAQLAEQISNKDKVSGFEVQEYIDQIKEAHEENQKLRQILSETNVQNINLKKQLEERPVIKEQEVKEVEIVPADYNTLKAKSREIDSYKKDFAHLQSERQKDLNEIKELKDRIADLESRSDLEELQKKLETEAGYFAIRTYEYIQKNGGYVWITERMEQLPEKQRKEFIDTVYAIDAFAKQMVQNIGGYKVE